MIISNRILNIAGKVDKPRYVGKHMNKAVDYFSNIGAPEQRLLLGAGAISFQPLIDFFNPDVDRKTAHYSTAKTVVKNIVGPGVGVPLRLAVTKFTDNLVENKRILPDQSILRNSSMDIGSYKKMLGALASVFVLIPANFLIDMPLSKFGLDTMVKLFKLHPDGKEGN